MVRVHGVYRRHMANGRVVLTLKEEDATVDEVVEVVAMVEMLTGPVTLVVMVAEVVVVVDVDHRNLDVWLAHHGDPHIMGTVRAVGNNIIHRKVCSTSQCDLETLPICVI